MDENIYQEISKKYEAEFTFDEPIDYMGITIYPVEMKKYFIFFDCIRVLCMNKNVIPDPKIISMSYLDFLVYLMEEEELYQTWLYFIVSICVRDVNVSISYGKNKNGKSYIKINGVVLYKKEFDFFRKLILAQNIPEYQDEYIDPELKKEMEEVERLKGNSLDKCSLEKQIVSIIVGNSMKIKDVYDSTIRKFFIMSEMIDKKVHYIINKSASMSGFVEFKTGIVHYLMEDKPMTIEDKVLDYEQFQNKINNANN